VDKPAKRQQTARPTTATRTRGAKQTPPGRKAGGVLACVGDLLGRLFRLNQDANDVHPNADHGAQSLDWITLDRTPPPRQGLLKAYGPPFATRFSTGVGAGDSVCPPSRGLAADLASREIPWRAHTANSSPRAVDAQRAQARWFSSAPRLSGPSAAPRLSDGAHAD